MVLTPEEMERQLLKTQQVLRDLKMKMVGAIDHRIPLISTAFDVESAVFPPTAKISNSGNQSVNNDTATVITMDTTEFNTGPADLVDLTNNRIVIQQAGIYLVTLDLIFANNSGGSFRRLHLDLNGSNVVEVNRIGDATIATYLQYAGFRDLAFDDKLTLVGHQDSGGGLNSLTAHESPSISVTYLCPI